MEGEVAELAKEDEYRQRNFGSPKLKLPDKKGKKALEAQDASRIALINIAIWLAGQCVLAFE